jgi:hypothetical protein
MDTTSAPWQDRFELKTCTAAGITKAIPAKALGVAVVYAKTGDTETIYYVLESRAGSLRAFCKKRLETAKIPEGTPLHVSFKCMTAADETPAAVSAACREQVIVAGALRRELRPSMR